MMTKRTKERLKHITLRNKQLIVAVGSSKWGTVKILGDIVGPAWKDGPWDAELGIAYHGETGPVYWVRGEMSEIDDQ